MSENKIKATRPAGSVPPTEPDHSETLRSKQTNENITWDHNHKNGTDPLQIELEELELRTSNSDEDETSESDGQGVVEEDSDLEERPYLIKTVHIPHPYTVPIEQRNEATEPSEDISGEQSQEISEEPSEETLQPDSESLKIDDEETSGGIAVITLIAIFILSVATLTFVYTHFPEFEENEKAHLKFPTSIEDAKILGDILYRYKDKYFYEVLSGICVSYIFLQTFAIPGSIFLSIMSGFLFSFPVALLLICFCSATGASFCYLISYFVGRRLVYRYFPEKAHAWSETVKKHKDNLLNYIIFLRVTPLIPNWFINITSPVLDVPLFPFWLGTFLGVGPPSIVAIQAGTTLHELTSANDAVSWTSLMILLLVGVVSLIPVLLKDTLKSHFD